MNALLEQFLLEARENLAYIDQNLESISNSDDPELLNAVFRAAHTLKGGSGIVGFDSVKEITHAAEDLLDMLRANKIEFKSSMLDALYDAFDEVVNLVEAAEETGDVVEADEAIQKSIVDSLNAEMGKGEEVKEEWQCPFSFPEDIKKVINLPFQFEKTVFKLPLTQTHFDEEAFSKAQLYAVEFDVDESCLVYGNDPIYTLSLLKDGVVSIHCCMEEDAAKAVLSGIDDPDGLLLKTRIVALVHGTYTDIEDALFNFIDELKLQPLDVVTLLECETGEQNHQLDVIKEMLSNCIPYVAEANRDALKETLAKSLPLIGEETIQHHQIQRFLGVLDLIQDEDLLQLGGFFEAIAQGKAFTGELAPLKEGTTASAPVEEVVTASEPTVETETKVEAPVADPVMIGIMENMLKQQVKVLETVGEDAAALERVNQVVKKIRVFKPHMPDGFKSATEAIAWMNADLNGEAPVTTTVEEKKVPEKAEEVVVKTVEQAPEVEVVAPEPVVEEPSAVVPEQPKSVQEVAPSKSEPAKNEPAENEPAEKAESVKKADVQPVAKKNVIGKTVKIEQGAIDSLMNIVGELLVAKNSLPYLAEGVYKMNDEMISRAIMEKYTFINRLSDQLQELIMSMRMLPISYVFDRYPKLVRDISRTLGKKVKLQMDGGETKLDKNMIEMLADPLVHIMRNSMDHGIEKPDIRAQKGKDEEGNIYLKAYAQSDKIIIEVKDDGAGINVSKVVNKVLEKGLLSLEQIEAMSDDEQAELVMLPGLSTADAISEYSGRGVGMDVVRKSVEGFGGNIKIQTKPNVGTTITLTIPASLAVTSLLQIVMDGINYGLPMDSVSETVKIQRSDIEFLHNEPFIYIRGEVIPLIFIKNMLNESALDDNALSVVVLNVKENLIAVVVNELKGQIDIVQKPLEGIMENHPIFSGTALLGNGQVILAIDPLGILSIANKLKQEMELAS